MENQTPDLTAQIRKLRSALAGLIPWAGESPDGPPWATGDAKRKNREMYETALRNACECFPENYNGLEEEEAESAVNASLN